MFTPLHENTHPDNGPVSVFGGVTENYTHETTFCYFQHVFLDLGGLLWLIIIVMLVKMQNITLRSSNTAFRQLCLEFGWLQTGIFRTVEYQGSFRADSKTTNRLLN